MNLVMNKLENNNDNNKVIITNDNLNANTLLVYISSICLRKCSAL
jgi:hypothetical protein